MSCAGSPSFNIRAIPFNNKRTKDAFNRRVKCYTRNMLIAVIITRILEKILQQTDVNEVAICYIVPCDPGLPKSRIAMFRVHDIKSPEKT